MNLILGIRHHGPGCARSIREAFDACKPDLVLLEGPPDAEEVMTAATDAGMTPPVALLIHQADDPGNAVFYPFAEFSPEWQALTWALREKTQVRFMDLPCCHRFAIQAAEKKEMESRLSAETGADEGQDGLPFDDAVLRMRSDPLLVLAEADGYNDSERWWNDRVEERGNAEYMFAAILEAMTAVRTELKLPETADTLRREAWMRRCLRQAEKESFQKIAVVCGAWHAPALAQKSSVGADNELLKNLPKCKVNTTWVPWTYERLCSSSGYGAGIASPGWYDHLFQYRSDATLSIRWMARAAQILREKDLDASSAHVIESVRMAESLAALRTRPLPGLPEMNDAILSVFCHGDMAPLKLVARELLVSERLGQVPEGLARPPLQQDIEATQKRLRLKPSASQTVVELDLREANGQERSCFLYRLCALNIRWGRVESDPRGKGTFKEIWHLEWKPELTLAIIDASRFGNTVETAATAALTRQSLDQPDLENLSKLLEIALFADLPKAVEALLRSLAAEAARGDDVLRLLKAVPPLVRLARYGNVRQTDAEQVNFILDGFIGRIHAGILAACAGIDDEVARSTNDAIRQYHKALDLLESAWRHDWQIVLDKILNAQTSHPLLAGTTARLLYDVGHLDSDRTASCLQFALSRGQNPNHAAAWLEGFLSNSGLMLLHDERLLRILEEWVAALSEEHFVAVLPLVRRSFSTFSAVERIKIGERIGKRSGRTTMQSEQRWDIDEHRARMPLPLVAMILGLKCDEPSANPESNEDRTLSEGRPQ